MLFLNELQKIFRQKNFYPKKSLGQNFLIDGNIQQKILKYCQLSNKDIVLEIGSGLGQLTQDLARKVKRVYAVEKDEVLGSILKERLGYVNNIEIINQDILRLPLPLRPYPLNLRFKVIGNLPYYIATPILTRLIDNRKFIDFVFITVQKELSRRILATPTGKDYGAFTVFLNYYTQPAILFPIRRTCFYPRPEVDSCFLKLEILNEPRIKLKDEKLFFKIVRTAFGQRRKTILSSLAEGGSLNLSREQALKIFLQAGIEPQRRPETLSINDFARIVEFWRNEDS
jgi:16S rRNA (adenine1518-N6/adenine1519-N6)-dimethyltransferase